MLITFTVKDVLDGLYRGAKVKVFTATETLVVEGTTDVDGKVVFDLTDGTYVARVSLALYPYVAPQPFAFTVAGGGDDEFILRVEVLELPSADNPNFCRVSGHLINEGVINTKVVLERVWPRSLIVNDAQVACVSSPYTLSVDDNYCITDLLRGARYRVSLSRQAKRWWVQIPDAASADIGATLFPMVKTITPESAIVALTTGEEQSVGYSQRYYSGLFLSSDALQADGAPERQFDVVDSSDAPSIVFTSSDTDVVRVEDDCGLLRLIGVGAGVATISAALSDPWADFVRPSVEQTWVDLIEVEVT